MPRTAATGRRKQNPKTPLEQYNYLKIHKKIVCWNYLQFILTNGEEGWNTSQPGSVYHQRSSNYLLSLGSDSWFRHIGKSMVTLAQKLAELNEGPPRPTIPTLVSPGPTTASPPPAAERIFMPTSLPSMPSLLRSPPRTPQTPLNNISFPPRQERMVEVASARKEHIVEYPPLPFPISFGQYMHFDYTSRKRSERMMVRIIVHNGVERQHVEFEWLTPRVLKILVAWPEWFTFAEQMAAFTADDDGEILFPPSHPMTMDMSDRNQQRVGEDGMVWDEGFIKFEQDMMNEEDAFVFELLSVDLPSRNTVVRMIQFYCQVESDKTIASKRGNVTHARTVNLGTGQRNTNPANARTSSQRAREDDTMDDEEGRDASSNTRRKTGS